MNVKKSEDKYDTHVEFELAISVQQIMNMKNQCGISRRRRAVTLKNQSYHANYPATILCWQFYKFSF